ncbi:MAG: hypothetical protein ABS81_00720 [Pseudonocardia sp. SCN 72-86]|nr:MAG: hypothetical protein ABS81_00720 [Pseudonocardia sp. SCN 72-86]
MSKSSSVVDAPARQIPFVQYLDLGEEGPRLMAQECESCGARFFDRRLACARCSAREFRAVPVSRTGRIGSFTIVHRAAPGVPTPYVSAVVYLDDETAVKANIVGCPADPEHVSLGQRVELTTFPASTATDGTTAVAFGFTPIEESA